MKSYQMRVDATSDYLKNKIEALPEIGILTGTGLGDSVDIFDSEMVLDYTGIPNFPIPTVQSHKGKLIFGNLKGKRIMALQGRFHLYEGYSPLDVTFPVRIMQMLGVRHLIISNAAGGLSSDFTAGDIMVIRDQINLTGKSPLTGKNEDSWGERFPDMMEVYDKKMIALVQKAANRINCGVCSGIYAGLPGPALETPAETRYLKTIGADAVGMSTVLEAIAGVHAGMHILGLSVLTNINDPDYPAKSDTEEIIKRAEKTAPELSKLIRVVIEELL